MRMKLSARPEARQGRRHFDLVAGIVVMLAAGFAGPAQAASEAGTSPWVQGDHSAVRLLAMGPDGPDPAMRHALIEIRLDPGYLTYWRQPGDAGLPPTFATAGSANVASVDVAYPAPGLFDEAGAQLFGYRDHVAFPLTVQLRDPGRPATLVVKLDYGVCGSLCLPGQATLSLDLPSRTDPAVADAVAAAQASVPAPSQVGAAGSPSVLAAVAIPAHQDTPPALKVTAQANAGATLFTEGPEGWFFPAAAAQPGPNGTRLFTVPVTSPTGATGQDITVRFTLVDGPKALDVPLRMDVGASKP